MLFLAEVNEQEKSSSISVQLLPMKSSDNSEEYCITNRVIKRKGNLLDSDDEELAKDSSPAHSSASSMYKELKIDLPEVVSKKGKEKPLPHPFPLPSNYCPEVELCL